MRDYYCQFFDFLVQVLEPLAQSRGLRLVQVSLRDLLGQLVLLAAKRLNLSLEGFNRVLQCDGIALVLDGRLHILQLAANICDHLL